MTILEHVRGFASAIEIPSENHPTECKMSFRRKLIALSDEMDIDEDMRCSPETEIPIEVFELLGIEGRKLSLSAFVVTAIEILNEEIAEELRS